MRGDILRSKNIYAVTVLALGVLACSPGEELTERVLESQEGIGNVEIDEQSGEVRIEGEGGDASGVLGGGEVPDEFPVDVPNGGEVQAVLEQGSDATVSIVYRDDDFDSIAGFFELWVEGSGLEEVSKFEASDPPSVGWTVTEGDATYSISVVENAGEVLVNVIVVGS